MTTIFIIVAIIFVLYIIGSATKSADKHKSGQNKYCSKCNAVLNNVTTVEGGLGRQKGGGEICINCYAQISYALNNRPLPNKASAKYNVPTNEKFELYDLPDDIDSLKLNTLAQISYTDAQGQKSVRRITMKSIRQGFDNDYLIQSFCHEKQADRSFKLSRISSLVDMETGEVFSDPSKYFLDRLHDSPLGQITKCFQELEAEILILSFIARADGFLRKKERDIIMNFITQKSSSALDPQLMDDEIRRTYCNTADFRTALKTISKKADTDRELIFQLANNIVQTDKKPDPMELGTLELIKKELKVEKASA